MVPMNNAPTVGKFTWKEKSTERLKRKVSIGENGTEAPPNAPSPAQEQRQPRTTILDIIIGNGQQKEHVNDGYNGSRSRGGGGDGDEDEDDEFGGALEFEKVQLEMEKEGGFDNNKINLNKEDDDDDDDEDQDRSKGNRTLQDDKEDIGKSQTKLLALRKSTRRAAATTIQPPPPTASPPPPPPPPLATVTTKSNDNDSTTTAGLPLQSGQLDDDSLLSAEVVVVEGMTTGIDDINNNVPSQTNNKRIKIHSSTTMHQCERCGKVYKHKNCLVKHGWEHHESWNLTKKWCQTKHQQVQMLEAAHVLVEMTLPIKTIKDLPPPPPPPRVATIITTTPTTPTTTATPTIPTTATPATNTTTTTTILPSKPNSRKNSITSALTL